MSVRISALLGLCLILLAPSAAAPSDMAEVFARLPTMADPSLSPDGGAVAYVANQGGERAAVIVELETGEARGVDMSGLRVGGVFWHDADTLMVRAGLSREERWVRGIVDYTVLVAVNRTTLESRQLLDNPNQVGFNPNLARIAGREAETGRLLMPVRDEADRLNLIALDPETGRFERLARGREETRYWAADRTGRRFARVDYRRGAEQLVVRVRGRDSGWATVLDQDQELIEVRVEGFTDDGDGLLVSYFTGPNRTRALRRVDIETGAFEDVLYQDEMNDFAGLRRSPWDRRVLGLTVARAEPEPVWFDPVLADLQQVMEEALPDRFITLWSWSADRARFILRVDGAAQAPQWRLFDAASGRLLPLASVNPELDGAPLPRRRAVTYTARDGATVPAFLTRPDGEGPHPFVILPHGGPEAADTAGFDPLAHFLGRQGYGVIQPNFRGSSGYGKAWAEQAYGQWGLGVIQHDLTDARAYLVEAGLADPERICIAGASYGGYAALAGAAFTPELYACAAGINGVYDLLEHHRYLQSRFGRDSQTERFWGRQVAGVVDASDNQVADASAARSPVRHADQITIPVLLVHGEDDSVVDFDQSLGMRRALERAGRSADFLALEGGDHWLTRYETRVAVFTRLEAFLDEHIGPGAAGP